MNMEGGRPTNTIVCRKNFSLAANTTYGCGGVAARAYFPSGESEAQNLFSALNAAGERYFILGGGSNILAQDGYYDGSIISTRRLCSIVYKGGALCCGSGATVSSALSFCRSRGLTGLEYLAGIPATMGGILYMNGGAGGNFIADNVISVTIFDGKLRHLNVQECGFTYKHSVMRDENCLILSAELAVSPSTALSVGKRISERLAARAALPKGHSCGCVFENYRGVSAGSIIDGAGLKGCRIGGAVVSEKHANFIINCGGTSSDVYALIVYIKDKVYQKYGITLKEEVCYLGDF